MRRSALVITLAMLVSGCTSTQPEASIAASGIVGCSDQAVWGRITAVADGRATVATERWLIPSAGAATIQADVTEAVGSHGLLVITGAEHEWYSDKAGLDAENAWEQDGRWHDTGCEDDPQG